MTKELLFPVERLNKLLEYRPESGQLIWKRRTPSDFTKERSQAACDGWNKRFSGKETFTSQTHEGYLIGSILGTGFLAHRVAYALHHGHWPVDVVDHINGNRTDNRIANLRDVTVQVNAKNRKPRPNAPKPATGYERVKAARMRKKLGLIAVSVPSEATSLDVTPDQLEQIKAWSEQNSEN